MSTPPGRCAVAPPRPPPWRALAERMDGVKRPARSSTRACPGRADAGRPGPAARPESSARPRRGAAPPPAARCGWRPWRSDTGHRPWRSDTGTPAVEVRHGDAGPRFQTRGHRPWRSDTGTSVLDFRHGDAGRVGQTRGHGAGWRMK